MAKRQYIIDRLLEKDPRYKVEAYQFVREALAYAQEELGMGARAENEDRSTAEEEPHLSGQQLCEAIRIFAQEQYGLLARIVLRSWGLTKTSDFGDIVYNLIDAGLMKKSKSDRREDFDEVYDFDEVFLEGFRIVRPE